jgi:hypothetical protein
VLIGHAMLQARLAGAGLDQVGAAIVVQPMLASKAEFIVGVSHEPNVGHFLVVGLGGVMAEMLDRVTLIPVPSDNAAMRDLLEGSLVAAMMARLDPKGVLMDQLIGVLESLQRLAGSHGDMIESVDINPLLVTATGLTGVDALVVLRSEATDPSIRAAS